jgi:SAM-dependent methyltransferase
MKPYADHFSRLAPAYASCRPGYPDELFTYLAGLLARHELAWDCAAGSGQATLPLARRFQRVVATDASAAMLDQAPRHPKIEYRVATAEKSGLSSGTVDLVVVAQALHWLDLDRFYSEAARVLIPGGVLAVWTYGTQYLHDAAIDPLVQRFYSEVVGPFWPSERRHVESGYRTLPFPFPELEPESFAMEEEWNLSQLLGYLRTWSATQRYRESHGRDPVEQLSLEIEPLWGENPSTRTIRWPLSLRVGRRPPLARGAS